MMTRDERHSIREGVQRMVRNLAIQHSISISKACFLVTTIVDDLRRKPPSPPVPPTGDTDPGQTGRFAVAA